MTLTARIALVLVATLGYLGLAILGWGSVAAFFSHPARTAPHHARHDWARHDRARHVPARATTKKAAPVPAAPVRRIFDDPVLRMATGVVATTVEEAPPVSRTLALALGLLVLVSAAFVGVAAREMAQ